MLGGQKGLAWGFAMAPHGLCILVINYLHVFLYKRRGYCNHLPQSFHPSVHYAISSSIKGKIQKKNKLEADIKKLEEKNKFEHR